VIPLPRLHPQAEAEFLDAVAYYEAAENGLGDRFDAAVARAVQDIADRPNAWPKFPGWGRLPLVRSRKVSIFPYRVVYVVHESELVILAIAHQHRHPGYWKHRLDR